MERPRSTRGVCAQARAGCAGRARARGAGERRAGRVHARSLGLGAGKRGRGWGGEGGTGGGGVCPLVSLVHSLAGALFRSLPGRESGPGCGRGRVRERSVPEREGRPARWARTEPGRARGRPERSRAVGRAGGCAGATAAAARSRAELSEAELSGPRCCWWRGEVSCAGTSQRCSRETGAA